MANIPIWPGSSSFHPGDTPFGFYDNDPVFEKDADKVCTFVTRRLGYPLVEIELQAINIYAAFEEAVTIYGNELYAYKIRENYLTLEGAPSSIEIDESIVTPNLGRIIDYSEQYGTEAGTGGNVPWRKMGVPLSGSVQDYDLDAIAAQNGFSQSNDIEIMRVFYENRPASALMMNAYDGFGFGLGGTVAAGIDGVGGLGGFGYGGGYLMMPLNYDMQIIQQIEMNDMVRISNYSFEMHDNVLRVFPIPTAGNNVSGSAGFDPNNPSGSAGTMWVEFMLKSDRSSASIVEAYDKIKMVSGVPYKNPKYNEINSVGRSWIFEMTLAICKEMLGYVRGKYETIPIPNAEITLNQADLIAASREEKEALLTSLRAFFDETSREKLLERRTMESNFVMEELDRVPRVIYIG
tara:strand:- start:1931 stop:3148 length:1218 start_codon:yes stop_codon:yes gene_type:complete